jgi:TPR repeat protein
MAAQQGVAQAQFNLGVMYFNGEGVGEDIDQAILWIEKAARQDMAIAQYTLGMFYQDGKVIQQDLESARHWLNQAALNHSPEDDFLDDLTRRIKLLLTDG